ncbi:MAG: hypothetical protein ACTSQY_02880 [Candidatus Odinarchaeia archaeon]
MILTQLVYGIPMEQLLAELILGIIGLIIIIITVKFWKQSREPFSKKIKINDEIKKIMKNRVVPQYFANLESYYVFIYKHLTAKDRKEFDKILHELNK